MVGFQFELLSFYPAEFPPGIFMGQNFWFAEEFMLYNSFIMENDFPRESRGYSG